MPAITAARNPVNVRQAPGTEVELLPPFSAPPAAVVYVMPADVLTQLGGWGEEYEIASGEDVDLCFKAWVNDLDVVYDQRVLVEHVSKASASQLDDWKGLWAWNRQRFLDKWTSDASVPRIDSCDPERFARNREIARGSRGGWRGTSPCAIARNAGSGAWWRVTGRFKLPCSITRTGAGAASVRICPRRSRVASALSRVPCGAVTHRCRACAGFR